MTKTGIQKFFGESGMAQTDSLFDAHLINVYFGGIDNVSIGIQAYERNGNSIIVMIGDTFRNAMGISKYFNYPLNTSTFFNRVFYSGINTDAMDQIVPTMTQGLMYFGPVLCFIPSVIMVLSICISDKIWAKTNNLYLSYLLATFATMVGWSIPGSYMHFTTKVFNLLIPMLILLWIFNPLTSSKKYNEIKNI